VTGRQVGVVGLGLIGASLAGALRACGDTVRGFDVDESARRVALERGLVDRAGDDLEAAVAGADLVVLAVPVLTIVRLLPNVDRLAPDRAVIMDVGSVKRPVIQAMEALGSAPRAIGGHPIAGKSVSGPQAADRELFRDRTFALVPTSRTDARTAAYAESVVRDLGARPLLMDAGEHDRIVARTSHLPQLMSTALALSIAPEDGELAGPGLVDMTRLAASPPSMWVDILASNAENIVSALATCLGHLESLGQMAASGDGPGLERAMSTAGTMAAHLGRSETA
jgi:prephenate dehydrogenase